MPGLFDSPAFSGYGLLGTGEAPGWLDWGEQWLGAYGPQTSWGGLPTPQGSGPPTTWQPPPAVPYPQQGGSPHQTPPSMPGQRPGATPIGGLGGGYGLGGYGGGTSSAQPGTGGLSEGVNNMLNSPFLHLGLGLASGRTPAQGFAGALSGLQGYQTTQARREEAQALRDLREREFKAKQAELDARAGERQEDRALRERLLGLREQEATQEAQDKKAKAALGQFKPEQELRKEFEAATKPHIEVRQSYGRVVSSKDNAAGDLALIFGFMKMLDPGSVVRETEFANAQNAAGVPDQIRNMYNRVLKGERLNPNQREQFKGQAGGIYQSYKREYGERANQFRGIAKTYGLDDSRVIPDWGRDPGTEKTVGGKKYYKENGTWYEDD
jgi:hypothetical protein